MGRHKINKGHRGVFYQCFPHLFAKSSLALNTRVANDCKVGQSAYWLPIATLLVKEGDIQGKSTSFFLVISDRI